MPKSTDSIEGKSSKDLKEMLMQTSVPDSGEREEEEVAVETEETEEVEAQPEETAEAETKEEAKTKEETESEKRYRLKVEGKEEELPLSKILEYAQKGRFLERERARDKERLEKLEKEAVETKPTGLPNIPPDQLNEWFLKEVNTNPVPTLLNVVGFGINSVLAERESKEKSERMAERKFELAVSEENPDLWKHLKPVYQEFRDKGIARETAYAMATADFYRDIALRANEQGMKKGEKKAKAKQMAEIPIGEKRAPRGATEVPSTLDATKMSSAEIAKFLKRNKTPNW